MTQRKNRLGDWLIFTLFAAVICGAIAVMILSVSAGVIG